MSMDTLFIIMGLISAGALYYSWRTIYGRGDKPEDLPAKPAAGEGTLKSGGQHITLEAVSQIWTKRPVQKIKLAEIAHRWRKMEKVEVAAPRPIEFRHEELMRFYLDQVKSRPFFVGQVLDATLDLLCLLDEHGDCPSVVNLHKEEPEVIFDVNTYTELAKTPLYLHSVHVALEAIRRVPKGALVPKAAIAALAHDLGKLPAFYDRYYHSGTHAFAGIAVMETLPSVKNLKYIEEIASAVRTHHIQSEDYLGNILRESDQAARRGEIAALVAAAVRPGQDTNALIIAPEQGKKRLRPGEFDPCGNVAQSKDLLGVGNETRHRAKRKKVDISSWFEPERFIRDLLKIVNTAQQDEKFWSALELNGYVYVKQRPFWQVITRHSNKNVEVIAAAVSEQHRDDITYSVVMKLKERENTIAAEFLGDGYFGAVFLHNQKAAAEKQTELYLIPFRAEAFGDNINNVLHKNSVLMRNTVELVPKLPIGKRG